MDATEQFVATARRLFETVPGSAAQRSANKWLIRFQSSPDAWRVALDVLQRATSQDGSTWRLPPTVLVVTMQLLRYKITHEWNQINEEQCRVVRQTILAWLKDGNAASVSPPTIRVACVIVANLVAKMYAREWPTWHQDLQQQLQKPSPHEGIVELLEIYGAIPAQLESEASDIGDGVGLTNAFSNHVEEITRVAREALAIGGPVRDTALRCIEHWGIGCIPSCPELGIDVALLVRSSLLPALLELGVKGDEQAASGIVADVFMSTSSDPLFLSPKMVEAVVHTVSYLESARQEMSQHTGHERDETMILRWQSLSQITSSIALHHAVTVFSPEAQDLFKNLYPSFAQTSQSLSALFLELVLACTAFPDPETAQPTLEFWFFLLDGSIHQGVQMRLLSAAFTPEQLVGVLSRAVNALIKQSRYPTRLIEAQTLPSAMEDDPEVESITSLRKEIGDTILSLFSKWPTTGTTERGVSCVKGMAEFLSTSTDVATLDAVLFLLEYTIELFDIESSGSEDEDLENDENSPSASNEGAQLLQHILLNALELPNHSLLVVGVTRFYQSLAKSVVLPGTVYIRVARKLCYGLDAEVSYSICAHTLLSISKSIVQYTEIEERRELLEIVATKCQQLHASSRLTGEVVEAAFRLTQDLSESDFMSFCNAVLCPLTQGVTSSDIHVASVSVALLGRAIGGVQNCTVRVGVANQVWPLMAKAIEVHGASTSFRECVVQYFTSAIVKNPSTSMERLQEIVVYCVQWLPHTAPVTTLQCLSSVVSNTATHNAGFLPIAHQIVEVTLTVIAQHLHFDPSMDDTINRTRLDKRFADEEATVHLTPEVIEFFALLRLVQPNFASSLARDAVLSTVLRLCWLLLDVDHQVQDICDSVCDFLLDVCSSQSLLSSSPAVSETLAAASPHLLRAVLAFFGPKRMHYKQRNLWQFLFQLLHAPRIAAPLKAHFHSTMTNILVVERVLIPPLSPQESESLAAALSHTSQRHRFVALLTQTGKQVEAMSTK